MGSTFYLITDYQAERKRVVSFTLESPARSSTGRKSSARRRTRCSPVTSSAAGSCCHYLRNAHSVLRVHAADGSFIREIELPGYSSVADACKTSEGIEGRANCDLMHFRADLVRRVWVAVVASARDSGETTLIRPSSAAIDPADYVVEQVTVTSADGTPVTMFLTRRADVQPNGDLPGAAVRLRRLRHPDHAGLLGAARHLAGQRRRAGRT